jgi:hypothetical protein
MDGDTSIGRRKLLVGAGAGLGALALAGIPATASATTESNGDRDQGEGLTGSWLITLTFPRPFPATTSVVSFAAGGVYAEIYLNPQNTSTALGTWKRLGRSSFRATFWQTTSVSGSTFAVRVDATGTFNATDISTSSTFDVFLPTDLTTPIPGASGSATGTGTRIVA